MSDILKQIQALQEQFSNLFETGATVNRWADAAQKRIDDNPYMGITSRGKEELERLKEIAKLPRDGKAANEIKKEAAKAEAEAARKGIEADLKGNKAERDRQEGIAWKKGLVAGDNKGGCFTKWRAKSPEMNDNNSYNEIVSQIMDLKEAFSNLFEVEGLGNPAVDVPPSQNKIKKDRKTKDGKVEVVSVEDELFPYEGNKREQYRQKILDTINNMIQGTATLEDLLQIVRQKKAPLKEAMEVLENLGSYIQNKYGDSKKGKELYDKYFQNFNKEANAAITKERAEDIEKKDKKPLEHYVKKLLDKRNETKNSKGEFKTDNRRDVIDQEYTNVNRESDPEGKKAVEKSLARHFDKVLYKPLKSQVNITRKAMATEKFKRMNSEALEEAFTLIEAIISEVSIANLQNTASRVIDDREFNAKCKIPRFNPEDPGDLESVYDDEKYANASRIVHHMPEPKGDTANNSANKLFNAAWKSLNKRKEACKKAKPGTPESSRADKRYFRAFNYTTADPVVARQIKYNKSEALEEALEILEDLYSKIKEQPQEKRAALEAKYAKMKQKEGKGMLQRILDQRKAMTKQERGQEKTKDRSERALGNYKDEWSDYMDNTPHMYQFEALEILENIYNEINKKFMNGEIPVGKAIKLEKKFQNKMSPEKVKQDGKELEAQWKDSLEPKIKNVKNLKALRRNDKKKNGGKSGLMFTFDYRPESLEEAISALLEYTEADKKKAAKKVLDDRKREYLSKYANVLDAADIDGSENVPDGDMKDLERAEKRYEHAKKVANEAFEETLKILELFDRPDLLNDIDTALGSPVKKTFKKAISSVAVPKKEKKVKECKK